MIICECTGTTDAKIRAIARDGAKTVAEVARRCGAGACCQSCRPAIARILRTTAKADSAKQSDSGPTEPATI